MQAILKTAISCAIPQTIAHEMTALIIRTALLDLFGVSFFFGILSCTVMDSNAREPESSHMLEGSDHY